MPRPTHISVAMNESKTVALLQFAEQEAVTMSAQELTHIIGLLIATRGSMVPPIGSSLPPVGQALKVLPAAAWYVQPGAQPAVMVMLMNPGLGWIAATLPPAERLQMAAALLGHSKPAPLLN